MRFLLCSCGGRHTGPCSAPALHGRLEAPGPCLLSGLSTLKNCGFCLLWGWSPGLARRCRSGFYSSASVWVTFTNGSKGRARWVQGRFTGWPWAGSQGRQRDGDTARSVQRPVKRRDRARLRRRSLPQNQRIFGAGVLTLSGPQCLGVSWSNVWGAVWGWSPAHCPEHEALSRLPCRSAGGSLIVLGLVPQCSADLLRVGGLL